MLIFIIILAILMIMLVVMIDNINNINHNTCINTGINTCINTCHKDANRIWVTILICNNSHHIDFPVCSRISMFYKVFTYQPTAQRQVHVVIFKRENSTRLIP